MPSEPLRVACLGGSITFGFGLRDRRRECYPAVLQNRLGDGCHVRNFGFVGAAAGRATIQPYWRTPPFTGATRFAPQVVVLLIGTNDAQTANLPNLPRFRSDLADLAEHFLELASCPRVVLGLPMPTFEPLPGLDKAALDGAVRPAVAEVAEHFGAPVMDAFKPFVDRAEWFPDQLHPNTTGAERLAGLAFDTLRSHDLAG